MCRINPWKRNIVPISYQNKKKINKNYLKENEKFWENEKKPKHKNIINYEVFS